MLPLGVRRVGESAVGEGIGRQQVAELVGGLGKRNATQRGQHDARNEREEADGDAAAPVVVVKK